MDRVFAIVGPVFAIQLGGCVPTPPATSLNCDAAGLADLVGRDVSVLQTMRFGVTTRIIGPDTAVTKDFNPDRLNFTHDKTGLIIDIGCY
jgi:hypothetical protein